MTTEAATSIVLRVHGIPAPQGSKTAYVRPKKGGKGVRAVVVDGSSVTGRASLAAWRQAVATAARDRQAAQERPLLDEPVELQITFTMSKPRSTPKWRRWPAVKPDLIKLVRGTEDALTGILIRDDSRVVKVTAEKLYGDPPGAVIIITPLGWQERSR